MDGKGRNAQDGAPSLSRRDFVATSAASAAAAALFATGNYAYAQGSDRIRVGVIGSGGRGTGAAVNAMVCAPGVEVVALGDLFKDRVDGSFNRLRDLVKDADMLRDYPDLASRLKVTPERCFSGFDNYQKVIGAGVDMVLLASPPGFRPIHYKAAVDAGKHVFMEKPVAVDGPGTRSVLASSEVASQKRLGVVAGTQRRHQNSYRETIKRLHDGAIGRIVGGQVFWNQGGLWRHNRRPGETDMEYQVRNWLYYTWLSGDHIVEQHMHNIDVANWVLRAHPVRCLGMGGRQTRTGPEYGHVFDHFAVDFEYPNGVRILSMCRQQDGTDSNVSERFAGTTGDTNAAGHIGGPNAWNFSGPNPDPYTQELTHLVASIRAGNPLNEGRQVAESTLAAIMGRMSAYTGKVVSWEQALNSQESLVPATFEFGAMPTPPVAMPGKTPLT
ncbi:MAG TPA: Gfo/Idh/MocA family oxidoreductase [Chthonomonadales bacterium]|nr:Gfo/Idh/MocA family oxidoreductase [Chthonomonadales bacterium]